MRVKVGVGYLDAGAAEVRAWWDSCTGNFYGTAPCGKAGGTESEVVGKTLTWPEKKQVAGEIAQQLHNPMFFQVIPGLTLPAAAGLHRLAQAVAKRPGSVAAVWPRPSQRRGHVTRLP